MIKFYKNTYNYIAFLDFLWQFLLYVTIDFENIFVCECPTVEIISQILI